MAKTSLQLWSLKKSVSEIGLVKVLEKVKKAGYDGVEFAGYDGLDAKTLKGELDRIGLACSGSHVGLNAIKEDVDSVIEYCKEIGCKYIICPSSDCSDESKVYETRDILKKANEKVKKAGLVLGYHNHDGEFKKIDGKYIFDILTDGDPSIVYELDTYWSEFAGVDSVEYMEEIKNRLPLVHVKDMQILADGKKESTVFGEGILDEDKIVKKSLQLGCEWLVIEWEAWDMDDIEAVTISEKNLLGAIARLK